MHVLYCVYYTAHYYSYIPAVKLTGSTWHSWHRTGECQDRSLQRRHESWLWTFPQILLERVCTSPATTLWWPFHQGHWRGSSAGVGGRDREHGQTHARLGTACSHCPLRWSWAPWSFSSLGWQLPFRALTGLQTSNHLGCDARLKSGPVYNFVHTSGMLW